MLFDSQAQLEVAVQEMEYWIQVKKDSVEQQIVQKDKYLSIG